MPKEKFYAKTAVEGDGQPPALTVAWGAEQPEVTINDVEYDASGLRRLITALRRAQGDAGVHVQTDRMSEVIYENAASFGVGEGGTLTVFDAQGTILAIHNEWHSAYNV